MCTPVVLMYIPPQMPGHSEQSSRAYPVQPPRRVMWGISPPFCCVIQVVASSAVVRAAEQTCRIFTCRHCASLQSALKHVHEVQSDRASAA